ncbi:MAG: hypothetical protein A2133_10460 [Actinobacteria bacterium RBG_16_64_13]|nr:MAG: hypothetical protein A2133_10460 [Actinobacteria bacterium RBG_16_64_13]
MMWPVVLVIGLALMSFLVGCGGSVSAISWWLDPGTRGATVELIGAGDHWEYMVLQVAHPDGRQTTQVAGNLRDGAITWVGSNLPVGTYSFTTYSIPLGDRDPESIPLDEVVRSGTAGPRQEFTIK